MAYKRTFQETHRLVPRFADRLIYKKQWDNFHLQFYKGGYRVNEDEPKMEGFFLAPPEESLRTPSFDLDQIRAIEERQQKMVAGMGFSSATHTLFEGDFQTNWRLAVGMGHPSVYENGLTLHFLFGLPYLPGSGIKGMLRNTIIVEAFEGKEEQALENKVFVALFGKEPSKKNSGYRGQLMFFDAFPIRAPKIGLDIINNHHQSYYEGKTPPGDWIDPNPVQFLNVQEGIFRIRIGFPERRKNTWNLDPGPKGDWEQVTTGLDSKQAGELVSSKALIDLTEAWLEYALDWHGFGAKTAVGYGQMKRKK